MPKPNYYADDPEPSTPMPKGNGGDSSPSTEDSDEASTLIPKSLLAGKEFEVGDEVVLKIVAMHEDEVEVAYASEEPKGEDHEEEPTEPGEAPPQPPSRMAGYMD